MQVLLDIVEGREVSEQNFGTALLEVMQFPLVLPHLTVDENYLGYLSILGYVLFALIAIVALGLSAWTHKNRNTRVVKASQPFFLQMVIVGVLLFASAIVPLSFDSEPHNLNVSCMATPWLMTIGFNTIVSFLVCHLDQTIHLLDLCLTRDNAFC